jgi:6-phosphogluconate dehydrogenase
LRIGYIGLGRMGLRMVGKILKDHKVIAYDINPESVAEAANMGAEPAASLRNLSQRLRPPRVIWMMVPAGNPVDTIIEELESYLEDGDILIDGGNSFYKDSIRRAERLSAQGVLYLDAGTSGGLEGAEQGVSLTVGGPEEGYDALMPLLETIATDSGHLYCGTSGTGHYVKMVHNGIEYAMLQALGEGFEMIKEGPYEMDLEAIAKVWNRGTVIRSWMLELAGKAFTEDPGLRELKGEVGGGETGRWMVETAMERGVPTPSIALSLMMRYRSRQEDTFAGKVVAAIRREFGGHPVKSVE